MMNKMNPKVDDYLETSPQWKDEIAELRRILLDTDLVEEWKWATPTYALAGKNVILIYKFKDYMGIGFVKGILLRDQAGILVSQGENSREVRLLKFTDVQQIRAMEPQIRAYILEAIDIEKAGLKVPPIAAEDMPLSAEFTTRLSADPALKAAFERLTRGRQRAYGLYFTAAKQEKTRIARIEACIPRILAGKGIDE